MASLSGAASALSSGSNGGRGSLGPAVLCWAAVSELVLQVALGESSSLEGQSPFAAGVFICQACDAGEAVGFS